MPFKAFEEFAEEPIRLPVQGKVYEVPPIGAKLGLLLARALEGDKKAVAEIGRGDSFWGKMLGPVYQQMVADDVPMEVIGRAGFAVMADFQYDREAAERVWESGLDPEARAALMAAMQTGQVPTMGSLRSPSTAAANRTQRRANSSGTRSPKASSPRKRANRSPSRRSSASGG